MWIKAYGEVINIEGAEKIFVFEPRRVFERKVEPYKIIVALYDDSNPTIYEHKDIDRVEQIYEKLIKALSEGRRLLDLDMCIEEDKANEN